MKKIVFAFLFIPIAVVSAQTTPLACTNLSTNLVRGAESKNVLALQSFLYAKGLLKATPNGFFGPATLAAVKAYQKSVGLAQVGNTGPATRAAIKKDSCANAGVSQSQASQTDTQQGNQIQSSTSTPNAGTIGASSTVNPQTPAPIVNSIDSGTLFAGASTTWSVIVKGSFPTTPNTVIFRNRGNGRRYVITGVQQTGSTTLTLPASITLNSYPCGSGCNETLPVGSYDLIVANEGGESNQMSIFIRSFSISSLSATLQNPVKQVATSSKFGVITFAGAVPFTITDISSTFTTERVPEEAISNFVYKDEVTKQTLPDGDLSILVYDNQSKVIGLYGDTTSTSSGSVLFTTTVTIVDALTKREDTFTAPSFLSSLSGF